MTGGVTTVWKADKEMKRKREEDSCPASDSGITTDISDHKNIHTSLRESEQKFLTLAENSPTTILRYDRNCRCIYANPEYTKRLRAVMKTGNPEDSYGVVSSENRRTTYS